MDTHCERRGQVEVGIVIHGGHVFTAFGSSVTGRHLTAYTRQQHGLVSLTRWDGSTMLACRGEIVREYHVGSLALMFRLTRGRFIVGFALGDDGMLFRGELLTHCDDGTARREAISNAEYWSEIDAEDEASRSLDDSDDGGYPDW